MMTGEVSGVSQTRLRKTIDHVLRYWIPVNSDVFKKIQRGLVLGGYEKNREQLVKDLRSDVSLYAWCLQRLCHLLKEDQEQFDREFDPIRVLENLDYEDLKNLLDVNEEDISRHSFDESTEQQMRIMKEAVLSATAADVIAQNKKEDRAYGASVLRQLGLTLIAWNYSTIFEEVTKEVRDGKDLDTEIAKRLGFSPLLLAMKVVQSWGVNEQKCLSLGLLITEDGTIERLSPESEEEKRGQYLSEVCAVGEKLARANDAFNYPQAKQQWIDIEHQVMQSLGDRGIAKIRERFEENIESYSDVMPSLEHDSGVIFDKSRYPGTDIEVQIEKKNKHVAHCAADLQLKFKNLYKGIITKSEVDQEHIRKLIHEIVPVATFSGCCIYTFDPSRSLIYPQLHSGDVELRKIRSYNYTMNTTTAGMIPAAYQSSEPILEDGIAETGMRIGAIAGAFGRSRKIGIVYLEYPKTRTHDLEQTLTHFRAITAALSDCLNLH